MRGVERTLAIIAWSTLVLGAVLVVVAAITGVRLLAVLGVAVGTLGVPAGVVWIWFAKREASPMTTDVLLDRPVEHARSWSEFEYRAMWKIRHHRVMAGIEARERSRHHQEASE